jgi:putative nucleotidyltransferase with HDIG domain
VDGIIAQEMNLSEEECDLVFRAGMLHDIGKKTTPDSILLKPGKLSGKEFDLIKHHVVVSYNLLSNIPMYSKLAEVVRSHHERYDGHGYPNGLCGEEIPLLARVMIVADAFDAMTTNRIYKGRVNLEGAIAQIKEGSGTQFDPEVVPFACAALSRMVLDINVNQLPQNNMEEERFAYYYHDAVTDKYNKDYLILFLQALCEDVHYRGCVHFLKNFSQYNKTFGWEKGNVLLMAYADYLTNTYSDAMIFRIHGDDFVLISKELLCDGSGACSNPPCLDNTGISVECHCLGVESDLMEQIRELEKNKYY